MGNNIHKSPTYQLLSFFDCDSNNCSASTTVVTEKEKHIQYSKVSIASGLEASFLTICNKRNCEWWFANLVMDDHKTQTDF